MIEYFKRLGTFPSKISDKDLKKMTPITADVIRRGTQFTVLSNNKKNGDRSFQGDILEATVVDLPYVLVKWKSEYSSGLSTHTLDVREYDLAIPTQEYIDAKLAENN